MSNSQYLLFVAPFVLTLLLIFGMKYFAAVFQARARLSGDAAYRALAEQVAASQSANQAALAAIRADLGRMTASMSAVEKILQQV